MNCVLDKTDIPFPIEASGARLARTGTAAQWRPIQAPSSSWHFHLQLPFVRLLSSPQWCWGSSRGIYIPQKQRGRGPSLLSKLHLSLHSSDQFKSHDHICQRRLAKLCLSQAAVCFSNQEEGEVATGIHCWFLRHNPSIAASTLGVTPYLPASQLHFPHPVSGQRPTLFPHRDIHPCCSLGPEHPTLTQSPLAPSLLRGPSDHTN